MTFDLYDVVVLTTNLPTHGLRAGEIGSVVETYPSEAIGVEFVTASGRRRVLVELKAADIRPVGHEDLAASQRSRS